MAASKPLKIPKVITHKNMGPLLTRLQKEPAFMIGACGKIKETGDEWYREQVWLEFPTGEACEEGLKSLALVGVNRCYETCGLTGKEGFAAQGLEGKVRVRKDLFTALMNLRDLLPVRRGRIVRE